MKSLEERPHGALPFASGFREPNGIKTFGPDKDLFVTDNQGAWIGACKLNHVKDGRFYGHPTSIPAPKDLYGKPRKLDPPAVWFPYKWVRSASDIVEITDDRFGPFKGQMLVGDFQNAVLTRVQLEKVNGEWQGAVWPFLKGFQSSCRFDLVLGDLIECIVKCVIPQFAAFHITYVKGPDGGDITGFPSGKFKNRLKVVC